MDGKDYEAPIGRLVLVMERQLTEASRGTLRNLLAHWWHNDEVTWVSGLSRASMFDSCDTDGIFYNRDFVSPEQAVSLMPWREVWLVAGGRVWRLQDAGR